MATPWWPCDRPVETRGIPWKPVEFKGRSRVGVADPATAIGVAESALHLVSVSVWKRPQRLETVLRIP